MNGLRAAALAALLGGVALIGYAAAAGQVDVGFFLIIPYVVGSGPAAFFGMMLLMLALVLWFFGAIPRGATQGWAPVDDGREPAHAPPHDDAAREPRARVKARHGGVVLLGPIPIVWGSDRRILPWMVGAGAALLVLAFLLTRW